MAPDLDYERRLGHAATLQALGRRRRYRGKLQMYADAGIEAIYRKPHTPAHLFIAMDADQSYRHQAPQS